MTGANTPTNRLLPLGLVLAAVGVYLVLFYTTRLPSLEDVLPQQPGAAETVFRRVDYLLLLLYPDVLLGAWFGSPPGFSLADRLPVLLVAVAIISCAACAGWLVLRAFRVDGMLNRPETFVFSTAVGLNLASTYVLLVGLLGWLRNPLVVALPAVLVFGLFAWLFFRGRSAKSVSPVSRFGASLPASPSPPEGKGPRVTAWLALPFAVIIFLGAMLPPVDFDVREYHLQVPKEFYQQGRIGFLAHNVYGNMALGTEMLSLLAMLVARDWWLGALAGKTVIAAFAPLTALALWAAGCRFFSSPVGVIAALVYISTPWIVDVSSAGLVEGASACYLLLTVYAILLLRSRTGTSRGAPAWRLAALAGYAAGSAVATKYPAALFVLLPAAVWAQLAGGQARRLYFLPLGVFVLSAALACGSWFGKNWALTGNPTYPLLYSIFDGKTWTPDKDRQWNRVHRPHDFSPGRLASDLVRVGLTSEWLSPLLMPLAALAFVGKAHRRELLPLALYFAYVVAVWWLLTHRIDRFWIPVLPLVALGAGMGACWSPKRLWRMALAVWLVLGLATNFLTASFTSPGKDTRYFVSYSRLRNDPLRVDAWHRYFNSHPSKGRLLLVGDAEVFDLAVPILYSTCFDDSIFEQLVKGRTAAEIRRSFAAGGITRVYVHWGEIERYRRSGYGFADFVQPAVFDRLVARGLLRPLPVIEGHPGRGYEVVAAGQ